MTPPIHEHLIADYSPLQLLISASTQLYIINALLVDGFSPRFFASLALLFVYGVCAFTFFHRALGAYATLNRQMDDPLQKPAFPQKDFSTLFTVEKLPKTGSGWSIS
jgi:hypothetical protein